MMKKILHNPQALIGLALIALVTAVALLAPVLAPHAPDAVNLALKYQPGHGPARSLRTVAAALWCACFVGTGVADPGAPGRSWTGAGTSGCGGGRLAGARNCRAQADLSRLSFTHFRLCNHRCVGWRA